MTTQGLAGAGSRVIARLRSESKRISRAVPGRRAGDVDESLARELLRPIPPVGSTERSPTIVLLNDCRDQVNFGARALVDGLVSILHDRVPDATIVPVPSYYLIDASGGLDGFVNRGVGLRPPRAQYPIVADEFEAVADEWMAGRGGPDAQKILQMFDGAHLVLLNGEGSVYRRNLSAIRELFLAWLAKTRLGIPTVYVNGTVHLTGVVPVLPAMVRKTFGAIDAVAVREPRSLQNLREYAPLVQPRIFPDSAFFLTPGDAVESDAVLKVRNQIGESPYFCLDPGPMPMDANRGTDSALHQLVKALALETPSAVFVCSAPADEYMEKLAQETGARYVDTLTDYREFMALTADAAFLVTGRYHNPILAAIVGCPSITLGSTNHKVHGACDMLEGTIGQPYDGTYLLPDIDRIVEQAHRYVVDRAAVGDRLHKICSARREEVMGMGDLVKDALRTTR